MAAPDAAWTPTTIEGVLRREVRFHADERGAFGELWRDSWTTGLGLDFVQGNISSSRAGTLRGLHFHEHQTDLWVVLDGRAQVAVVDLRPLLTEGAHEPPASETFELGAGSTVLIPVGVAHGFLALDELHLLYLVTSEYDGTDEHSIAWNDPLAAVDWLNKSPLLSARDSTAPPLSEWRNART
jgi:dTDP-4-dehydrorhamnose 3,5-epimerase